MADLGSNRQNLGMQERSGTRQLGLVLEVAGRRATQANTKSDIKYYEVALVKSEGKGEGEVFPRLLPLPSPLQTDGREGFGRYRAGLGVSASRHCNLRLQRSTSLARNHTITCYTPEQLLLPLRTPPVFTKQHNPLNLHRRLSFVPSITTYRQLDLRRHCRQTTKTH